MVKAILGRLLVDEGAGSDRVRVRVRVKGTVVEGGDDLEREIEGRDKVGD